MFSGCPEHCNAQGTHSKYSWNITCRLGCFNIKCMLLGRNFDFLGGYLVVTARSLVVTGGYYSLPGGYWWLLIVTARYCLFPLLVWTQINMSLRRLLFRHEIFYLLRLQSFPNNLHFPIIVGVCSKHFMLTWKKHFSSRKGSK